MSDTKSRAIFVNLAVHDLSRSMDFFRTLGFGFNPTFTDQNAACMILSEQGFVMLLLEPFFKGFTSRELCDTRTHTEALLALTCESRAEVATLLQLAVRAGGVDTGKVQEMGVMYGRSFYDLDGHHWELFWMDPSATQQTPRGTPHEACMQIKVVSIMVNNQDDALRFYTTMLGFVKMADIPMGEFRWLTVTAPEGVEGVELLEQLVAERSVDS